MSDIAAEIARLREQLAAMTADRDSWERQAMDRAGDAVQFAAERDALREQVAALTANAERWQHARRCARMDNFGGYVIHPDDPANVAGIADRFQREIDVARKDQP